MTMEPTTSTDGLNDRNGAQLGWKDVASASEEVEANTWEEGTSNEVINVKLTDADMADLLRANGADEEAKAKVDASNLRLKEELKEGKAESDAIAARIKDRNRAGGRGTQAKAGPWKTLTCWALNTKRFVNTTTGVVEDERPISAAERQQSLSLAPVVDINGARKDSAPDSTELTDPEALLKAAEEGESREDPEPEDESLDSEDDGGED